MDVIFIFNGLGNQMSQYSFYTQKKHINKSTYFIPLCNDHNGLELDRVFNIDCKMKFVHKLLYFLFRLLLTDRNSFIVKPIQKLLGKLNCKVVHENFDYKFKKEYLVKSRGITFYYGGWHSEMFFVSVKKELQRLFVFNIPDDERNKYYSKDIASTNSVSIHVRRGDFLNAANINLFGDVCNKEFDLISSKVAEPHFFVFSNDMEWVKSNLKIDNVTYITCNTGKNSWKDMYLMSLCKYNIVANSTFSWWGAWLNNNPQKIVIAPNRFLKSDTETDVYPHSWMKISENDIQTAIDYE